METKEETLMRHTKARLVQKVILFNDALNTVKAKEVKVKAEKDDLKKEVERVKDILKKTSLEKMQTDTKYLEKCQEVEKLKRKLEHLKEKYCFGDMKSNEN